MKSIEQIALEIIPRFDPDFKPEDYDADFTKFIESVLAAWLEQQEPVAWCEEDGMHYRFDLLINPGLKLYLAPPIPEGYQFVPVEPTEAMLKALHGAGCCQGTLKAYRAMLAAAVKP